MLTGWVIAGWLVQVAAGGGGARARLERAETAGVLLLLDYPLADPLNEFIEEVLRFKGLL